MGCVTSILRISELSIPSVDVLLFQDAGLAVRLYPHASWVFIPGEADIIALEIEGPDSMVPDLCAVPQTGHGVYGVFPVRKESQGPFRPDVPYPLPIQLDCPAGTYP